MTSSLLVRSRGTDDRVIASVAPHGDDWKYIDFKIVRLAKGSSYSAETGGNEAVLVFIEGTADVTSDHASWQRVGERRSPFDGPPQAVYLPQTTAYKLSARGDCEIAICSAQARGTHAARLIALNETDAHDRGTGNASRRIYDILMDPEAASTLFITEVLTPPGHWSSYPPHKHDKDDPPHESALEELYYYRARPECGFAFQRVYTAEGDVDETIAARDRDIVLVPRGYHVCAAAPEYAIYYLNVLAGPKHIYHMTFDPQHEWIRQGWAW